MRDVPRSRMRERPDWSAPEIKYTDDLDSYYQSQRWIGKLSRDIELTPPEIKRPLTASSKPQGFLPLEIVVDLFKQSKFREDPVERAVRTRVARYVKSVYRYKTWRIESMWRAYKTYVSALRSICVTFSLVQRDGKMLTEEEVDLLIGVCRISPGKLSGTVIIYTTIANIRCHYQSGINFDCNQGRVILASSEASRFYVRQRWLDTFK